MLDKGLRTSSGHIHSPNLRWLKSADARRYFLSQSVNSLTVSEDEFTSAQSTADPLACLAQGYRQNVLATALYNLLGPLNNTSQL